MNAFIWKIPDEFNLINRTVYIKYRDILTKNRDGEKVPQSERDIIEIPTINECNKFTDNYQGQEFILGTFYTIMERTGYDELTENEKLIKLSSGLFHQVMQSATTDQNINVENTKAFNWVIPNSLQLLDETYKIIWKTDKFNLQGAVGEINDMQETIELQKIGEYNNFSENTIRKTLLHEIFHKILFIAGDNDLAQDESLVDLLAGCWNQIFNTGRVYHV